MGDEREEGVEAFGDGFRAAGEIDDERVRAGDGDAAAESGVGSGLKAGEREGSGNARDITFGDVARGFGGDIARREAGAAGGDDEIGEAGIGPVAELSGDGRAVVGDDETRGDLMAGVEATFFDEWTGSVLAFTS